jgi:large subunit ribosomal protein L21
MFAVVFIGGKQYKVREKDELEVELMDVKEGENIKIKEVYMIGNEEEVSMKLGMPYVAGAHVECKVMEHGKGEKIRVFKMKAKKRYSKTQGHRQKYTLLKVLKVSALEAKAPKKAAAKEEATTEA